MLVYFEPASMCDLPADLILAPLPANKYLWEADDELAWRLYSEKELGANAAFGLARSGELVRLGAECTDTGFVHTSITVDSPQRTSARWEEWCEGMDGFGSLVILASSMVAD